MTSAARAYVFDDSRSLTERSVGIDDWRSNIPKSSFEAKSPDLTSKEIGFASKLAGRRNAASISQEEVDELYAERKALLDKKFFTIDFSASDRRRLALIRWKIDCVIDAKYGNYVDKLESAIRTYQKVSMEINSLKDELSNATMNQTRDGQHNGRSKARR